MKKTLTAALAAILLVTSLTGCNSDNEPNTSSDSSISNTSSDNISSDSGSGDNTSSDSGSSDNTSGDSGSSDNTSSGSDSGDKSDTGTSIADYLKEAAEAYAQMIKTDPNVAFYPSQQASAEGTVMGTTDDGYIYVIVHADGAEIEKAVTDPTVELPPPDPDVDNSGIVYPDNKAGEIAKRVLNTNWALLNAVSDQDSVNVLFSEDFKLDLCEEYFFASSMLSLHLYKVIIIKPKAGNMPA